MQSPIDDKITNADEQNVAVNHSDAEHGFDEAVHPVTPIIEEERKCNLKTSEIKSRKKLKISPESDRKEAEQEEQEQTDSEDN